MCPEFKYGGMENVGCICYGETYFTQKQKENLADELYLNIIIHHEIAHQWFGNLVTMKWWNDLWLNESFATVISYISYAMTDKTAEVNSWLQFVEETRWAYFDDLQPTTHSIDAPCATTDVAEGLIDGITYGKGAAFLRQVIHYVGSDNFFNGCAAYFKKYSFANTTLDDFFSCLQE